ncbi:MAG: VWA domain-containing protein [Spirochaetia bacterium]
MHHCSYTHELDVLPAEVREVLESEAYAAFMGDFSATSQPDAAPVPRPLADTARRLIATASFSSYTRENHALSERVAHEAVSWCNAQWAHLADEDPLSSEDADLGALERSRTLAEARERMPPKHRARLSSLAETVFVAPTADREMSSGRRRIEARARIAVVTEKWRIAIDAERERSQTRELGRALGSFVRELGSILPRLALAQSVVHDLFGNEDALWDLSRGEWLDTNWDTLREHAELLDALPELNRLAEILGRSQVATEVRSSTRVVREVSFRPIGLGKSEVTGVTFGDDLTSLLPSEVALLADPATEDLFYAKLARKEMLQLDYRRERIVKHTQQRLVPVTEEVVVPRGPVIVCVDTSGSMLGDPEQIAKAMTLALARRLPADRRELHVIAFSTSVRSLSLRATAIDLPALCEFLGGSFHGGTDLRPALAEALHTLETGRFEHADVLVISDFKIPKIADRFIDQIKRQQRRGTLFGSLTIARSAVHDPLHIFDNSWLFNVTEGARGIGPDTLRFLG